MEIRIPKSQRTSWFIPYKDRNGLRAPIRQGHHILKHDLSSFSFDHAYETRNAPKTRVLPTVERDRNWSMTRIVDGIEVQGTDNSQLKVKKNRNKSGCICHGSYLVGVPDGRTAGQFHLAWSGTQF